MDAFKGKFERISAENYEEILKVRFCTFKLDWFLPINSRVRLWRWTSCCGRQPPPPPRAWTSRRAGASGPSSHPPPSKLWSSSSRWPMQKTSVFCLGLKYHLYLQLGEKFDETTPDGRQVSSLATFDGGKLTIKQVTGQSENSIQYSTIIWPIKEQYWDNCPKEIILVISI